MASANIEEYIRGILTEYNNVKATADESIELRRELKSLRETFTASSAEHETALKSLRVDISEKITQGPHNAMENSKLQHEVKKLQSLTERQAKELQGAKDNIKRLQGLSTVNSNNIQAQTDQLQRMQATLSELEVEHMYSKSDMSVDQEPTNDEHSQEDHTEEIMRSSSMTLQASPIDEAELGTFSPDPLRLMAQKESNTKRKISPLESFINGDFSKRVKSTASTTKKGVAIVSHGEHELEADDRSDDATVVLAPKSKSSNTFIPMSQNDKRGDAVEGELTTTDETTNPAVSAVVSEVEQQSISAGMKSGKKTIAPKLDKIVPQCTAKASSKPSKDTEPTSRNHNPAILPTEASPHLPNQTLSLIVPVLQPVTNKTVSFAPIPQVAETLDGQAQTNNMTTMGPKRSKRAAKPRVPEGSVPWANLPLGMLFR
nr:hypothetical protein CFP56_75794 [Quercus suber]